MTTSPAETIAALERAGGRHETPIGDGTMVWHRWGHGRPVVLLHGGSGSWRHWIRNIEALAAAGREVWAPDLPGFGELALPPGQIDFRPVSAGIVAGIRQLIPDAAPLDIIGFSFGSHTAQYVARDLGGRVGTLVLVNGHIVGKLEVDAGQWLGRWRDVADEVERREILKRNLSLLMLHDPARIDDLAIHIYAEDLPRARVRPPRFINERDMGIIPALPCRIVNIAGEHDPLAVPSVAGQQERLLLQRPDATVHLVAGVGHWVMYEAADSFNALLKRAID